MFPHIGDSPLQLLLHGIFFRNITIRTMVTMVITTSTAIIQGKDDPSSVKTKQQSTHSKLIQLIEKKKQNKPRGCLINDSSSSDIVKGIVKVNESSTCPKERINLCIFKNKLLAHRKCEEKMCSWQRTLPFPYLIQWLACTHKQNFMQVLTLSEEFFCSPRILLFFTFKHLILLKRQH